MIEKPEPEKVDVNAPRKLAAAIRLMGSDAPGEVQAAGIKAAEQINRMGVAGKVADNIAAMLDPAKPGYVELEHTLEDALRENERFAAQNEAIRTHAERQEAEVQRLRGIYESPAKSKPDTRRASPDLEDAYYEWANRNRDAYQAAQTVRPQENASARGGLKRSFLAAAVPGAITYGAFMMGIDPAIIVLDNFIFGGVSFFLAVSATTASRFSSSVIATGSLFLSAFNSLIVTASDKPLADSAGVVALAAVTSALISTVIVDEWARNLDGYHPSNRGRAAAGTLAGVALSVALAFGGAALAPEKPVTPDQQKTAVERPSAAPEKDPVRTWGWGYPNP